MKCELNPNFKNISGKCGGLLYKTFTRRDGKKETRVYILPKKADGKFGYERTTMPKKEELARRARFAAITARVSQMSDEEKHQYAVEMKRDKYKFNGKKYCTLRGYIIARLYAEYKDGVNC